MKQPAFLTKFKKRFAPKQIMLFWYCHYKVMIFIGFLVVFAYSGFHWYHYLHEYQWDEEQKAEFLKSYIKETDFKEERFQDVINHIKERGRLYGEEINLTRDIFE